MMGSNEEKEDIDVAISALQSALDYNKESVLISRKQLDKVISQEDLSENEVRLITEAVQILQVLNSQSIRDNEFLFAEKKIMMSRSKAEVALTQLEMCPLLQRKEEINKRIAQLLKEVQVAKQQCKELQQLQVKRMADEEFLRLKVEEQKKILQDLKNDIQNLGIADLEEDNEKLQDKMESSRKMRNECAVLQSEVDNYRNLPPNLAKAKEVLKQTKQEYENVCKQLNSKITQQKRWKPGHMLF